MGKSKSKKAQAKVAETAEAAQDAVSDVATSIKSAAQDTAQQTREQVEQAAQVVADERGKSGAVLALLLLLIGAAVYWRMANED